MCRVEHMQAVYGVVMPHSVPMTYLLHVQRICGSALRQLDVWMMLTEISHTDL